MSKNCLDFAGALDKDTHSLRISCAYKEINMDKKVIGAFKKRKKLRAEGKKLLAEGKKLLAENDKLNAESDIGFFSVVVEVYGKDAIVKFTKSGFKVNGFKVNDLEYKENE